jgi:hypothetical protein
MSHSIEPIPLITTHFGDPTATPVITAHFKTDKGWFRTSLHKRVSRAAIRKLRDRGVTQVQLHFDGRTADFSVDEILRS